MGDKSEPATGARAQAREDRRQAMLDAAVDLVRRDGPLVSMEQIAAACGVTKPVIYRFFGDRDELVLAMAERFVDDLIASLSPNIQREAPPFELLAATMDAYLDLIERDPHLYRFISDQAADKRDLMASLVAEQVAVVLERLLDARGLDQRPARAWAYGMVGMVHFAGDWWVERPDIPRAEMVTDLTALLWRGFEGVGLGDRPPAEPRGRARRAPRRP